MQNGTKRPNRLRYFRRLRDLNQEELAARAGLHPQTVSDLERGRYKPSLETAAALARELGCSVEDLFLPSASGEAPDDSQVGSAALGGSAATTAGPGASVAGEPSADRSPGDAAADEIPAEAGEEAQ